jgi:integration host factor subunit alpha
MTLTKADFAEQVFDELGFIKREAHEIIECFFEAIKDRLEQGEPVKLSGFGKFTLRDKSGRPGRNPKTGETVPITPRRVVTFKVSPKLKAQLGQAESIHHDPL